MRRASRKPIIVTVYYPETEEGMKEYKQSHSRAVIDILENKLGEKRMAELISYMKVKLKEEQA
ncbi:hypothetical protein [Clostridium sp.]|uniref:hypothetical protein n=1 Tax=Clostridium sp. TaxID=1506 RepID=UPI003216342D